MRAGLMRSTFFCGEPVPHSGLEYVLQRFYSLMHFRNESADWLLRYVSQGVNADWLSSPECRSKVQIFQLEWKCHGAWSWSLWTCVGRTMGLGPNPWMCRGEEVRFSVVLQPTISVYRWPRRRRWSSWWPLPSPHDRSWSCWWSTCRRTSPLLSEKER